MTKRRVFRSGAGLLMAGLLAVAACSDDDDDLTEPGEGETGVTVEVRDDFFVPDTARIPVGGTVTWNWTGANPHNVISVLTPTFSPSRTDSVTTGSHGPVTFATAGTYQYICDIHGGLNADSTATSGMSGVVVVFEP